MVINGVDPVMHRRVDVEPEVERAAYQLFDVVHRAFHVIVSKACDFTKEPASATEIHVIVKIFK